MAKPKRAGFKPKRSGKLAEPYIEQPDHHSVWENHQLQQLISALEEQCPWDLLHVNHSY